MNTTLAAHWILPVCRAPLARGFIRIERGRIAAMGVIDDLPAAQAQALHAALTRQEQAEGTQSLLTPGLINAHTHLELSQGPALPRAPHETMADWLLRVLALNRQTANDQRLSQARCRHGVALSLASGVSAVNDISRNGDSIAVLAQAGMRGVVSMEFFHGDGPPLAVQDIITRYHTQFDDAIRLAPEARERLKPGLSPHSPYNVSPDAWRVVVAACASPMIHSHAGESYDEWRWVRGQPSGLDRLHRTALGRTLTPQPCPSSLKAPARTPIAYLEAHGLLNTSTVLAHGVFATAADRLTLARRGVSLVHCPRSNLALTDLTLYWPAWQATDIALALGSDSLLSTPDLDMRAEARTAQARHGWCARTCLERLTRHGALALGWGEELGVLRPGAWADLTCWHAPAASGLSPEDRWLAPTTQAAGVWVAGRACWPNAERALSGEGVSP